MVLGLQLFRTAQRKRFDTFRVPLRSPRLRTRRVARSRCHGTLIRTAIVPLCRESQKCGTGRSTSCLSAGNRQYMTRPAVNMVGPGGSALAARTGIAEERGWVKCSQVLWPTGSLDGKPPRLAKRYRRRIRLALFEHNANCSLLLRDVHFVFAR